jgi:hypothetical protein
VTAHTGLTPNYKRRGVAAAQQDTPRVILQQHQTPHTGSKMWSAGVAALGALWSLPALGQLLLLAVILFLTWYLDLNLLILNPCFFLI